MRCRNLFSIFSRISAYIQISDLMLERKRQGGGVGLDNERMKEFMREIYFETVEAREWWSTCKYLVIDDNDIMEVQ